MKKDLGVKVGTKEQAIWEEVAKQARAELDAIDKARIVQLGILDLANTKVELEKKKFK